MRPNAHAESKHRRKPPVDIVDGRVVMTRMTPWSPAQGPGSDAPLNASGDDGVFRIDTSVEGAWVPRHLSGDRSPIVQIVDGVRRVEAYAVSDTTSGAAAPALFGSYAVGVVRCEPNRATVLTDPGLLRVERRYLQAGSHAEDLLVRAGQTELCFRATPVPQALKASDLVRELTSRMLAAEARLVNRLSADCGALTLVDGPLRASTTGRRVAGTSNAPRTGTSVLRNARSSTIWTWAIVRRCSGSLWRARPNGSASRGTCGSRIWGRTCTPSLRSCGSRRGRPCRWSRPPGSRTNARSPCRRWPGRWYATHVPRRTSRRSADSRTGSATFSATVIWCGAESPSHLPRELRKESPS